MRTMTQKSHGTFSEVAQVGTNTDKEHYRPKVYVLFLKWEMTENGRVQKKYHKQQVRSATIIVLKG